MTYAFLIPARNEAATLPALFEHIRRAPTAPDRVIVVDNGSTDETADLARRLGAQVVAEPRAGYGQACLAGLDALAGQPPEVVVFLDADDYAAPEQIRRLLEPIERDAADMVVGERSSEVRTGVRWHARLGNWLVLTILRGLYGDVTRDMGPFRAVRWTALTELGMEDRNFGWYVQMQVRALRHGLRVHGTPVRFVRREAGVSKVSGSLRGSVAAGYIMLRTLAREVLRPEAGG